jgi:hypothetical protein
VHWGTEIAGKVKAWAKALNGPAGLAGKYPQLINPPGSETGSGQVVTWSKSTVCSVDAFGYKCCVRQVQQIGHGDGLI